MELFAEDQNPVVWCIALSAFQVLSPTSPPVLAPRPVWGPRCGQLGAKVDATRKDDRAMHPLLRCSGPPIDHALGVTYVPCLGRENEQAWKDHLYFKKRQRDARWQFLQSQTHI